MRLRRAALASLVALTLIGALTAPAIAGRTPARAKPTRLKAIPGTESLSLSWSLQSSRRLVRWRLSWRRLTAPVMHRSKSVELSAHVRSHKITGLVPGSYLISVQPLLSRGKRGGLAKLRVTLPGERPKEEPPKEEEKPKEREKSNEEPPAGTTFYVSPTGSDKNPGTIALPWRTLTKVNSASLKGGDTVLFEGGAVFSETNLVGNAGGEPGKPITYGSYGVGKADVQYGVWDAGYDYLVYENLLVAGKSLHSGVGFGGRGSDVTVKDSTVTDVSAGVNVVTGDRWHIVKDTIEETADSGILTQTGDNGGHPGDSWIIDNNVINRTGLVNLGYGEHGIYLKCRDSEVADNTITNFAADGISQRYGNGTLVRNKISAGGTGIAFFPYDNQAHTSTWAENEVTQTEVGFYAPAIDPGSPPPGGTTLESFVLSKNVIGPLTGSSTDWINMHTKGTITKPGGNTLL